MGVGFGIARTIREAAQRIKRLAWLLGILCSAKSPMRHRAAPLSTASKEMEHVFMATKGSTNRAEANPTLRTVCANCRRSIPTEVGHPHPLDESVRRETWGLVSVHEGRARVIPTCTACYDAGWRPPGYVWMN